MSLKVRPLGDWEDTDMLSIAQKFHAEASFGTEFNEATCLANWRSFPERRAFGLFAEDTLVGALAAILIPQFFTGAKLAQEMFWYVAHEYRGTSASIRMLVELEQWAKSRGAYGIVMASLASSSGGIERLYARRGYQLIETHHLKLF